MAARTVLARISEEMFREADYFNFNSGRKGLSGRGEFLRDAIDQEIELLEYDLAKQGFTPWGTHDAVTIRAASADADGHHSGDLPFFASFIRIGMIKGAILLYC